MASEVVIGQVIDEIRQSIFLINESLGSEKHDTSAFADFSVSTVLDVCDIRIVDELPPISPGSSESLFVFPYDESQNSNTGFNNNRIGNSITQQNNSVSNYILVTAPQANSTSFDSAYSSNATGNSQSVPAGAAHYWDYDDCESTSEGSFLSECDSDLIDDTDLNADIEKVFEKDIISRESNFRLDIDDGCTEDSRAADGLVDNSNSGNYNQTGKLTSRSGTAADILDILAREGAAAPQGCCGYSKDKPPSIYNGITLDYTDGDVIKNTSVSDDISSRYIGETGVLKRHVVLDFGGEERRYKAIKYESQIPVCTEKCVDRIFY
ncbi:hypothetical protein FG386_000372 [Cryptosporidium ryanae]|uniref:uncharacterized protein n=1 Tax=Cryptosporidium ryanae TaxID=515981 RepID=UPI00351A99AE|nr:hypothetical protein FG386_000372 [Cryptosporidium ryanae]